MLSGHESAVQDALRGRKGLRVRVLGACLNALLMRFARGARLTHTGDPNEVSRRETSAEPEGVACANPGLARSNQGQRMSGRSARAGFRLLRTRLSSACMATTPVASTATA